MSKLGDNAYFCIIRSEVHNWLLGLQFVSGRWECTIFKCVTTIRLCHLQGILPKFVLLACIDTLVVQAKCIDNKLVVHVKTTRDRRSLAVTNKKFGNAALSHNFIRLTNACLVPKLKDKNGGDPVQCWDFNNHRHLLDHYGSITITEQDIKLWCDDCLR